MKHQPNEEIWAGPTANALTTQQKHQTLDHIDDWIADGPSEETYDTGDILGFVATNAQDLPDWVISLARGYVEKTAEAAEYKIAHRGLTHILLELSEDVATQ